MLLLYGAIGLASLSALAAVGIFDGTGNLNSLVAVNAAGMVTYIMLALFMPSGENQVTARRLAVLPLGLNQVRPALMRTSLLSSRVLIAAVLSVLFAVAGGAMLAISLAQQGGRVAAVIAFAAAMVLSWATTILFAECIMHLGASVLALKSDKAKAVGVVAIVALMFAVMSLSGSLDSSLPLGTIGSIAAWTPLGAATGWATALAAGHVGSAFAQLVIAFVTAAILWWLWRRAIAAEYARPAIVGSAAKSDKARGVSRLRLGGWAYRGPGAMEFSRSLAYVARDSRFAGSLLILALLSVFAFYQLWRGEEYPAYAMLIMIGLLGGLTAANDYGYDGPSGWLKMAAPVPPRVFLRARNFAHILPAAVVIVAVAPQKVLAACIAFAALGTLASSAALSVLFTVFNAYPTSAPGANLWTDKSGYSAGAFIAAFVGIFVGWIPILPGMVLITFGAARDALWMPVGAAVCILVPGIVYAVALVIASKRVDRRMPEIYSKTKAWVI
ncbi:hypothetical protein [Corynebacterium flavescens]|uniref:hypothetical protein n=1 Tax=Corynebacterium flavescens TaxID=28028 RepID=UPI003FD2EAF6